MNGQVRPFRNRQRRPSGLAARLTVNYFESSVKRCNENQQERYSDGHLISPGQAIVAHNPAVAFLDFRADRCLDWKFPRKPMNAAEQKTIVVGVTGASGAVLAQAALCLL